MREILFRGKRIDNGEWVYGDLRHGGYVDGDTQMYIMQTDYALHNIPIIPETLGQYTGLVGKNGTKIFEGDICCDEVSHFTIEWNESKCGFVIKANDDVFEIDQTYGDIEVIGNIHDELKEVAECHL